MVFADYGLSELQYMVTVLIIDDSSFQRKILTVILNELGSEVIPAENGQEGIEKAVEHKPDILITDLLMPEYDGFWVLEQIKSRNMKIPTIVVTSDIQTTTKEQCISLGAGAFLNKPVKKEELHTAIREALANVKR
jgi:twitching motility two-component system response regulator PilH